MKQLGSEEKSPLLSELHPFWGGFLLGMNLTWLGSLVWLASAVIASFYQFTMA